MATMLNGAAVMDGALLLVAANETCPQPQTSEHLAAIEIMRLQHILILQNKIDLIRWATCQPAGALSLPHLALLHSLLQFDRVLCCWQEQAQHCAQLLS